MKQLQSGVILAGTAAVILLSTPLPSTEGTPAQGRLTAVTEVIGVQLNPTTRGLNVVLLTSTGDAHGSASVLRPQVLTATQSNTTVADIVNIHLHLPQGKSIRASNPAPGIASVVVTQLDPNSIQLVVTGTTNAPQSGIAQRDVKGITFSFSPTSGTASPPANTTPTLLPYGGNPGTGVQGRSLSGSENPPSRLTSQTTGTRSPSVLVPNPEITIDGKPVSPQGTTDPTPSVPPTLPHAVAPPVGDIAVSNTDSSPSSIELGTTERVPRLVLRDAPVREVLALLARAAGLNLVFTGAAAPASPGQVIPGQTAATSADGPTISLDIENESVQDVFNYVLRVSSLQANRNGNTILVGTTLPNEARNVIIRSYRLNQVQVGVALNFLVGFGAESAVSRERLITSVSAVPVGGSPTPATQTQTSTETRIETNRINFQDAVPLLRGLQAIGDERTNSITLIGSPKQVDVATTQLIQLDARRRQVAVNVKIVDVNLSANQNFNTSFSFGIGNNFFSVSQGQASVNVGGINPPSSAQVNSSTLSPPITGSPLPQGVTAQPFLNVNPNTNNGNGAVVGATAPFGTAGNPLQAGITAFTPGTTSLSNIGNQLVNGVTPATVTYGLPTLFQFPTRFLASLQAQVVSGTAKILTDPTLIVQEGQQANVNLTQQVVGNVSTQTNFTAGAAIQTVNVTKEQVGLTLNIRVDRIDDNGFVSLSVAPVVRSPQSQQTINLGGGNSQTIVLINERSLNSGVIRLRDSQTLILSGIIQDTDQTTVTKVPILGDIPILGALFRSTNKNRQRQEVIVLLTPQIIEDSLRATYGYNYTPSPEVRQILENRGLDIPATRKKK